MSNLRQFFAKELAEELELAAKAYEQRIEDLLGRVKHLETERGKLKRNIVALEHDLESSKKAHSKQMSVTTTPHDASSTFAITVRLTRDLLDSVGVDRVLELVLEQAKSQLNAKYKPNELGPISKFWEAP